jgi:hypothetical protein
MDMNWLRFALTVLAGGIVPSLTDWFFMGDLLYKRNDTYPEVWRFPGGVGESNDCVVQSAPFSDVRYLCSNLPPDGSALVLFRFQVGGGDLGHVSFAAHCNQCVVHEAAADDCRSSFSWVAGEAWGGSGQYCSNPKMIGERMSDNLKTVDSRLDVGNRGIMTIASSLANEIVGDISDNRISAGLD